MNQLKSLSGLSKPLLAPDALYVGEKLAA